LFGSNENVSRAQVEAATGTNLLTEGLPYLINAVEGVASTFQNYRPEQDPVVAVLSAILEAGLAADKFPSEAEAWAASRVLTKLREAALAAPRAADPSTEITPVSTTTPTDRAAASAPAAKHDTLSSNTIGGSVIQSLLTELDALVGLTDMKEQVETLVNLARVKAMRTERGLPSPRISFHLVFSGNPGTGKTSVARIVGKIFGALGLLSVGKCIEVDRAQLIGQYLGQTTTKTTEVLNSTLGSVLFIDEAYSLTSGKHNEFGEEAISVILKFMEDHRDDFVLIAAGYTGPAIAGLADYRVPGLRPR
jgi:SpoVK/Ycf46/Vps4 family AAA+-type ATPase